MAGIVKVENNSITVDSAAMRHSITIQAQGPTSPPSYDASGPLLTWTTFTTSLAAIETMRGTDVIRAGQDTTQLFLTVTMWWQPGILPNMRVLSDTGSTYLIQAIENILERNRVLVLNCLGLARNV